MIKILVWNKMGYISNIKAQKFQIKKINFEKNEFLENHNNQSSKLFQPKPL